MVRVLDSGSIGRCLSLDSVPFIWTNRTMNYHSASRSPPRSIDGYWRILSLSFTNKSIGQPMLNWVYYLLLYNTCTRQRLFIYTTVDYTIEYFYIRFLCISKSGIHESDFSEQKMSRSYTICVTSSMTMNWGSELRFSSFTEWLVQWNIGHFFCY